MKDLFQPLECGALTLPNRIIMAPLTRCRAIDNRVPNQLMADYYAQRANAGLIISEATSVDPMGVGYPNTPGIWSQQQVDGWKLTTDTVHKAGGRIFLQLWHVGRISDPIYLNGQLPVAPSAIAPEGHVSLVRPEKAFETPRALATNEIPAVIEAYRKGAENAKEAGFDGVEIHGANGYLLDQFLQPASNHRTDQYGGSVENRARLMIEVADAVNSVWGASRVGMHLAPRCDAHSVGDDNALETFGYVAEQLGQRGLAFLCTREAFDGTEITPELKKRFDGVVIANENFTQAQANEKVSQGIVDAVAFGKSYISNPDLVKRFELNADLNKADSATFYGSGPEGYTDYPFLNTLAEGLARAKK